MATALALSGMLCVVAFSLPFWVLWLWLMIRIARRYKELESQRSDRLQALIPEWASKERYTILFQERLHFWSTPFSPNSHRADYRVVVDDVHGQRRRGWVRFGSWPLGIFNKRVKVVWEQRMPASRHSETSTDPSHNPLWDDWLDH